SSSGVFKSLDAGVTWRTAGNGLDRGFGQGRQTLAIDPVHPSILFVTTGHGTYRTMDGAQRWTLVDLLDHTRFLPRGLLAIPKANDGRVYVATGPVIHVSSDHGSTWVERRAPIGENGSAQFVSALAVDPNEPDVVYA